MALQRKELSKRITAHRVALTPQPADEPPILSESASALDIPNKDWEGTLWLLRRMLDHWLKDDNHLEFLLNCGPDYESAYEPCNNVPEKGISRRFASMSSAMPGQYD